MGVPQVCIQTGACPSRELGCSWSRMPNASFAMLPGPALQLESNGPLMNVVSGTRHSGRWGCVPSQGHVAPWSHPWSVAPPQGSSPLRSCVHSKGPLEQPQCSGGAGALSHPPSTDLVLERMAGPDSALLLRWAQPHRVGDRGQAGASALWTPLSRAQATAPSGALLTVKAVFVVHWFLLTWADVSVPCTAAVRLAGMSGARRHTSSARALRPPPGVLSVHLPLGRKCGCAKAGEPVSPALSLSKQPVWVPKAWQGSGQSCRMGLCPGRGHVAPLGLGGWLEETLVSRELLHLL